MKNFKSSIVLTIIAALYVGQHTWAGTITNNTNKNVTLRLTKNGILFTSKLKPNESFKIRGDDPLYKSESVGFRLYGPIRPLTATSLKAYPEWQAITLVERDGKFEIDIS